jgi:uncharacterized protein
VLSWRAAELNMTGRRMRTDTATEEAVEALEARLFEALGHLGSVVVALSGGVDSAYLAWAAHEALGARALAVTGVSPSYPEVQREMVERLVADFGLAHEWIETHEMEREGYVRNAPDRCYFCKTELYSLLARLAAERGFAAVADGTNLDDLGDTRPGRVAAAEHAVRSPLVECAIGKRTVRELARRAGVPVWDAPASACLASRIPHGTPVTIGRLGRVERGEAALRALGFRQLRVRNHDEVARVEIARDELAAALDPDMAARIVAALKPVGFRHVALDLEGYRSRE